MTLPARTIADIYKERWQVEIFFRFIKQNLKIKSFLGNSKNAVLSQVYVAMIAYRVTQGVHHGMNLRRQASTTATNGLGVAPPLAPAECWWARTYEPSRRMVSRSAS